MWRKWERMLTHLKHPAPALLNFYYSFYLKWIFNAWRQHSLSCHLILLKRGRHGWRENTFPLLLSSERLDFTTRAGEKKTPSQHNIYSRPSLNELKAIYGSERKESPQQWLRLAEGLPAAPPVFNNAGKTAPITGNSISNPPMVSMQSPLIRKAIYQSAANTHTHITHILVLLTPDLLP